MLGSRSAGPAAADTTVKVSDRTESPSTVSRIRSPALNGIAGVCAVAGATLKNALATRSAATITDDQTRFISTSR